jgi:hypothetical protein
MDDERWNNLIYHRVVTTVTRRTPDVEQELFSLLEHLSSVPNFITGFLVINLDMF